MRGMTTPFRLAWLLATVVAIGPRPATAQGEPRGTEAGLRLGDAWRWVEYSTDTGLPSARVLDLVEDTTGTAWAATDAGLARFDGFRWHAVTDVRLTRMILSLAPDLAGGVIVVTDEAVYRGGEAGFVRLTESDPALRRRVRFAVPLDGESILLASRRGLTRLGPDGSAPFPGPPGSAGGALIELGRGRNGVVWISYTTGAFVLKDRRWELKLALDVATVRMDRDGGMLHISRAPAVNGLWTWNGDEPPRRIAGDGLSHVSAMDLDDLGRAVVVYDSGRVRVRDHGHWRWLAAVPRQLVNPLFVRFQRTGDLWVGTEDGLALFRASSRRWSRWQIGDSVPANQVNVILPASNGDLWVGTSDGVAVRRADGLFEGFRTIDGTVITVVTGLAEDRDGAIWVSSGSEFAGAFRFHDGAWRRFDADDGLAAPRVHRIVPDADGRLWFLGVSEHYRQGEPGAFILDGGAFEPWGVEQGMPNGRVYGFAEGSDGTRWFATDDGIGRLRDGRWTYWSREDGLAHPRVFCLTVDHDDRVWFGHDHHPSGVGFLDDDDEPRYLTLADGLVDPHVVDVATGADGAVWIATRSGLSRFHQGRFASFDRGTGLDHTRLWPVRPLADRVLVGTIGGGLYTLDLAEASHPAPAVTLLPTLVDEATALFRWQALPYCGEMPARAVETRFRIDDDPWRPWSRAREATAIEIPPGDHEFTVEAKSLFGNVTGSATSVAFRIPPPLHLHPLVVTGAIVWATSMLGLGAAYWRRRRRHEAALREREMHFRSLIENASDLITVVTEGGVIRYQSPSAMRLLGRDPDGLVGTSLLDLVHPDDRAAAGRLLEDGNGRSSAPRSAELLVRHAGGGWRRLESTGQDLPSRIDGARCTVLNSRDITERHRAEQAMAAQAATERLLRKELDHRVRNNLASLVSLIDLTGASAPSVDEFARSIHSRARAMVLVHSLLSSGRWKPVHLETLVESLVPPGAGGAIDLDGPAVEIAPARTQALGMVVNELMANSVKHGALGAPTGHVSVSWRAATGPDGSRELVLRWRERGGPPIEGVPKPGVGSGLIHGIAESELCGRAELGFPRAGVDHAIVISLEEDATAGAPVSVQATTSP
jgi:PAS domain S-box-containing protein